MATSCPRRSGGVKVVVRPGLSHACQLGAGTESDWGGGGTVAMRAPVRPKRGSTFRQGPGHVGAAGQALLGWYDSARRTLPWRVAPGQKADPYRVWLSEIMLQQTTVKAVAPYYAAFLRRWPSVEALAAASLDEVLAAWAGLGYYSRARNLHRCARAVVAGHGGRFPASEQALRDLPGVGAYTAAAIAAIAFGAPATPV